MTPRPYREIKSGRVDDASLRGAIGDDAADGLDAARNRRILAQRQVGASLLAVCLIQSEQAAKVPVILENHIPACRWYTNRTRLVCDMIFRMTAVTKPNEKPPARPS
jgi:hypothetical protein